MRVKEREGYMLIDGKAGRRRWAEYFEKLLNVQDEEEASVVAVGGDRRIPVFGRLKD